MIGILLTPELRIVDGRNCKGEIGQSLVPDLNGEIGQHLVHRAKGENRGTGGKIVPQLLSELFSDNLPGVLERK